MSSLELQEKQVILNSQFQDNQELIERLETTLLEDIIKLPEKDIILAKQFINDKASLFRSLKENNFDFDKAHSNLLETIHWRLDNSIDQLNLSDCPDFIENGFAFFYGTDNAGDHPLIFVRLGYFPKQFREPQKPLTDQVRPYAAFIMEIARKLTQEMTLERIRQGHPFPLVSRITVLVDVTKAPILPVDSELIKTMGVILNERFPGLIQSINVLNFGWMYQGVWSVLKYLLSDEAKSFIRFTKVNELSFFISEDRILKEFGGSNDFEWSIDKDEILQKYGKGYMEQQDVELPSTPLSIETSNLEIPPTSESPYISSRNSESNDEFFDAQETLPPLVQQLQPHSISPATSTVSSLNALRTTTRPVYGNLSSWAGLRMGVDFLTSFIDTKPPSPPDDIILVEPVSFTTPTHQHISTKHHNTLHEIENFSKHLLHQILQVSFGPDQGIAYWVLLYLFLRGPVESVVKKSLVHSSLLESKRITSTTIGVTAAVAALMGTGLTNTLEKFRK